jgi:hypothetical protein
MRAFPVSAGLLEHKQRMGSAIWEYLWLIDNVTLDHPCADGKFEGIVKFGQPISAEVVAEGLKEHIDTAKTNLRKLCAEGYIKRKRIYGAGYVYRVVNSKKWIWDRDGSHRRKNPPMESVQRGGNPPMNGRKAVDDGAKNPSIIKGSKSVGRQKPLKDGGRNGEHELQAPLGTPNLELCEQVLHKIVLPATPANLKAVAASIELVAKKYELEHSAAADLLVSAADRARGKGEKVTRFWFEDGEWQYQLSAPEEICERCGGPKWLPSHLQPGRVRECDCPATKAERRVANNRKVLLDGFFGPEEIRSEYGSPDVIPNRMAAKGEILGDTAGLREAKNS